MKKIGFEYAEITQVIPNCGIFIKDHHLVKTNQIYCLDTLLSNLIYGIFIPERGVIQFSKQYYDRLFKSSTLDWKNSYFLLHIAPQNTEL